VRSRLLVAVVMTVQLLVATGCAAGSAHGEISSPQECRRLRGKAAARGIGMAMGAVVVAGFVALIAAAGAKPDFGSGGSGRARRRQVRRDARAAACSRRATESAAIPRDVEHAFRTGPGHESPEILEVPASGGGTVSLSAEELRRAIAPHVPEIRACMPGAEGILLLDARIDGRSGRVSGIVLQGPLAGKRVADCVAAVVAHVQTRTFEGVVDVRWRVRCLESGSGPVVLE
jgi:hypothetical protein